MTQPFHPPAQTDTQASLPAWQHTHDFSAGNPVAERGTRLVVWITATMMLVEIAAGWLFNSMALLADGWHMSSHAVAIGVSAFAYAAARKQARDPRYAFGTWKIEVLGGFVSAMFLLGVAVMMVVGSVERLFAPQPIRYLEAMAVGVLGLAVNVVCALILHRAHGPAGHDEAAQTSDHGHSHAHGHSHSHSHSHAHSRGNAHGHASHGHGHAHAHGHDDLNLRAAYLHVIADAATSVLAILALAGGWWLGWNWLDPVMGIAGAVLVAHWAVGLLRETSSALLDRDMDHPVVEEIRQAAVPEPDLAHTRLTDLHVWRVGQRRYACALTLVTRDPGLDAVQVRQRLAVHEEIVHSTVEIHRLPATGH